MSPGLITGKVKASDMNGSLDHNRNINNNNNNGWKDESSEKTLLHSRDFSKIDSSYLDDYSNSAEVITKTTTTTTMKKESSVKNTYAKPVRNAMKVLDEGPVIKANISDKKSVIKMDPVKDFGTFSSLLAPALLSGKKTASEAFTKNESLLEATSSISSKKNSIVERETTAYSLDLDREDLKNNKTYSTTFNTDITPLKPSNGFKEESFLIKTDPSIRVEAESRGYFGKDSYSSYAEKKDSYSAMSSSYAATEKKDSYSAMSSYAAAEKKASLFESSRSKSPLDELSKSPLFNSRRERSNSQEEDHRKSPFATTREKSPVERTLPIRRDRSRTPDRAIIEKSSLFGSSSGGSKSPVPAKRKTPPPVARKTSSPGRSLIPKRTSSIGASEETRKSVATSR